VDTPLRIFTEMHVESFVRAGERLLQPMHGGLATPALVCAAFGAEIGLKALLTRRGTVFTRGHNLKNLLEMLTPEDRDPIVSQTKVKFPEFDSLLERAADAFLEWRYIYESKGPMEVNILFVVEMAKAVASRLEVVRGYSLTMQQENSGADSGAMGSPTA
jgi:hypothetical protein